MLKKLKLDTTIYCGDIFFILYYKKNYFFPLEKSEANLLILFNLKKIGFCEFYKKN